MALPTAIRSLAPARLRDDIRLRSLGLRAGLIPPRTMHSEAESALLRELAPGRRTAVEIGVYEGSSALVLCEALPRDADLHLIDPFIHVEHALRPGWRGVEKATRAVVDRAARRRGGPRVTWHIGLSEEVATIWPRPVDLVFIDGDHSEAATTLDWQLWHPFVEPGGVIAFHDARLDRPGGSGWPGPTAVVDGLFRGEGAVSGWRIAAERDTVVAVERVG